jgi:hypothetical protein
LLHFAQTPSGTDFFLSATVVVLLGNIRSNQLILCSTLQNK